MNVSYLFLAPGFEEMEAIAVVDVLRRGGVDVRTVSVGGGKEVTSAHQVTLRADLSLEQIRPEEAECLIFPGGMPGAQNLSECEKLMTSLRSGTNGCSYLCRTCFGIEPFENKQKTPGNLLSWIRKICTRFRSRGRWSSRRWECNYRERSRICYSIRSNSVGTTSFIWESERSSCRNVAVSDGTIKLVYKVGKVPD